MDTLSSHSPSGTIVLDEFSKPEPLFPEQRLINRRQIWANNRFRMEMDNLKTRRYGNRGRHHWYQLLFMMKTLGFVLHLINLYQKGVHNAESILLREMPLYFSNLPQAFEGFTILHLSDLHLDSMEGIEDNILRILENRTVDLCLLTGDYRTKLHGLHKHIINSLEYLVGHINSKHGFVGVLGNHDGCHMLNPMEQIGITMLVNSSCFIHQGNEKIRIIGTDDVHYYYTDQALHALEYADNEFSIALVHSPELYDVAAEMGVCLYLCGHTHAGQICLPGGKPLITHLNRGRKYFQGYWKYLEMQGITNAGVGASGIPVRFNTRGEVLIYDLHKQVS
ncbi:MAG: metallophosphoesterase [Proteobacteria bacterium]|nr:metallophosphoesterase [Pseudomonadota bacterium]